MTIDLMLNSSEKNKINKTLSTVDSLEGSLKEPSSIINPEITIQRSDPTGFNYCYIPEFGRYYFVTNVTVMHSNIIRLSLTVDVLESFKNQILAQNVIIEKNTNQFDPYLMDPNRIRNVKTKTDILNFPSGLLESGEFILITAGG